jgi:membrane associated rhomboid family serine protease
VLPLKDNIPTDRFPVVTVVLIAINVAVFIWQFGLSDEPGSSDLRELRGTAVTEYETAIVEYGAIPHRITSPGDECEMVPAREPGGRIGAAIVCEGTAEARQVEAQGIEGAPIEAIPWFLTLITSMFMHGGILHIVGNLLFLWVFGNNVEDSMGRGRFVAFYVLGGLVAVYSQALVVPSATTPTIGASGAVAGVLGGYILLHPRARVLTVVFVVFFFTFIEIPAAVLLSVWFALQFVPAVGQVATPDVIGEGGVAYLAHVGGFVFGLLAIRLFATKPGDPWRLGGGARG